MERNESLTNLQQPITEKITSKCNKCGKEITAIVSNPNEIIICKECKNANINETYTDEIVPNYSNSKVKDTQSLNIDNLNCSNQNQVTDKGEETKEEETDANSINNISNNVIHNERSDNINNNNNGNNNEINNNNNNNALINNNNNDVLINNNNANNIEINNDDNGPRINNKGLYFLLALFILSISISIYNNSGDTIIYENSSENNEEELLGQNGHEKIKKELIKPIIGIDFGSSYSGFSLGIDTDTIETKYENIEPTIIVMERTSQKGYKYGNEADEFMSNGRNKDYIYFDRIKTRLDPKFANNDISEIDIEANYPTNYKMKLKIVISEYLRLFSDKILEYVNKKGKNYSKDDIEWVVTVPAIWNEYGKQLMIDCSKIAGMNDITIALEPEAASLTMFNDNMIDKYFKRKGKKFMLIDAGGYIIDIKLNEIIDNHGNIKQLSPPSGGPYGSMNLNKDLIKLIEEIFGEEKN